MVLLKEDYILQQVLIERVEISHMPFKTGQHSAKSKVFRLFYALTSHVANRQLLREMDGEFSRLAQCRSLMSKTSCTIDVRLSSLLISPQSKKMVIYRPKLRFGSRIVVYKAPLTRAYAQDNRTVDNTGRGVRDRPQRTNSCRAAAESREGCACE
ncbi:hypothetical protein EVAR_100201_1 [Eumeta japonica]|uniref:Uncharacterized protein n=1 Tax=Eumeta variegata TaxID=151549 RepID=A0A4C1T0M7_EUMVA|nr:hypothetical protein EVAR_100201_1 [Eumeta japonica]